MSNYIVHWGIPGMKWGVRRYRNADGTLTAAGKRRYQRDIDENDARKKDNKIKIREGGDPNRWVKEDITRSRNVVRESSNLVNELDRLDQMSRGKKKSKRMNLSSMSDKEMRDRINRELLERQYDQLFNDVDKSDTRRGREIVSNTLGIVGATLGIAGSSLGIALSIKELKG